MWLNHKLNKRNIGQEQERQAQAYLTEQGYILLECNFSCRTGEIDIIAKDGKYLVFIEVKYRSSIKNGFPEEALTPRKIHTIVNTAKYYMVKHKIREDNPCRFDVVSILNKEIRLIKDAFEGY